jgi:hypothetical protein
MMQQMSGIMDEKGNLSHTQMMDISKTMDEMAQSMKELSGNMAKGKMDATQMKKLHKRMMTMHQRLDKLSNNKSAGAR